MELKELLRHIETFFSDRSRSASETREGLEEASAHIESMIDSLPEDEE